MADPLAKTFDLLGGTKALAAVELLIIALDSKSAAIQERAVAALLRRGATRCQTEVIRRFSTLSANARKLLEDQGTKLSATLRQCLLHGDAELRGAGMKIVSATECYDQVPTLLQILEQKEDPFQEAACQTLQDLVNRLFDQTQIGAVRRSGDRFQRNVPQVRQMVLAALDGACNRFATLSHALEVIECVLVLGDPENFAVRKLLLQSPPACREMANNLLSTSKHPGVMRLVMDFMGQNYPNAKATEAIENRVDPEFVCHVLRTFPKRLSENQHKNYRQLTRIRWVSDELLPLEAVPPALHESLVSFLQVAAIDIDDKITVYKWLLLHGSGPGRAAASQILETLEPDSVRGILFGSLDSEDEDVQAWATSQLRAQGVPEAIRLLIERLDSPLPAVRDAARGELGSFNLELMLNIFEHLDRNVSQRAGMLVRKIDPNCIPKLLEELASPIRRRRIRAARAAEVLGLATEVQTGLLDLLRDTDTHVRRTAIEVLVCVATPEVVANLAELLNDSSPRVREAAEQSLEAIHRGGLQTSLSDSNPVPQSPEHETAGG